MADSLVDLQSLVEWNRSVLNPPITPGFEAMVLDHFNRYAARLRDTTSTDDGNGDDGAYNRGWNDCREAMLATHPAAAVDEAVSRAYDSGFRVAANWMERDDLHADCGSQAYAEDKAAALHAGQEVGRG